MRAILNLQEVFIQPDDVFVTRLHRELLMRSPDRAHRRLYRRRLEAGDTKQDILKTVVRGRQFRRALRTPSHARIHAMLRVLLAMGDHDFVVGTYQALFGRRPNSSELQHHLHHLGGGKDRTSLVQDVLTTDNTYAMVTRRKGINRTAVIGTPVRRLFRRQGKFFLNSLYLQLLGRGPTVSERRRYLGRATSLSAKWKIWQALVGSREFWNKLQKPVGGQTLLTIKLLMNRSSSSFVRAMYREFLGRDADPQGLRVYRKLAGAGQKDKVVRSILQSDEVRGRLRSEPLSTEFLGDYQNLWPEFPVNHEFRARIAELLRSQGLPFQTRLLVCEGGLGDFIQMTAVAKALKLRDPDIPVVTLTDYPEIYDEHPYVDYAIEGQLAPFVSTDKSKVRVKSLIGLVDTLFDIRYISRAYGNWDNSDFFQQHHELYDSYRTDGWKHDALHMHVVDQMLVSLGLEGYASSEDTLVVPKPVDIKVTGDYVIVNNAVGSRPGQLKRWTQSEWDQLLDWLVQQGLTPVQLGVEKDPLLSPRVIDLRGKTSYREAATYLKHSRGFIGVEGGLFHLSKAVGTPAVVVFSSTSPETFAYGDTRVVTRGLCRPCWWTSEWQAVRCMYGYPSCINLPSWTDVANAVSDMLQEGRNEHE